MTDLMHARVMAGAALACWVAAWCAAPAAAQGPSGAAARGHGAEGQNMRLLAHNDLQGRSAYQPIIHRQGGPWIAYIGHHGGQAANPLTGATEANGTSIVDVTDPRAPRYLRHIPGAPGGPEAGGAQMVRACDGKTLPKGAANKTYLLRTFANAGHEVWDVTTPEAPALLTKVVTGLNGTHKNWWECESGIAYLVSDGRPSGWRTNRMIQVFDLSDPAKPVHLRDFGLAGQEPGSTGPVPEGLHGLVARGTRLYIAYGTWKEGVLQIVDREKLLKGDPAAANRFSPTRENLRYPQIGRLDMSPAWGGHTAFPVLGVPVPAFQKQARGKVRDFVVLVSESLQNECREYPHFAFLVDITDETRPFSVANFMVPEASGNFCTRGGRFGSHSSNESFAPIYYQKIVFIAYFNAGVRAVDIRDPYRPKEVGFYIPATTEKTDERCVEEAGARRCKVAIQTNNVEVDDRGFIYIVDRANTGLHILELTGPARQIANLP
jgi:hypothetical protein